MNPRVIILSVGSVVTTGLWIYSIKHRQWREYAWLFTLHLLYQVLKEFDTMYSWSYVAMITALELSGYSVWSSVSPTLIIRQANPLLDPYFPVNTSVIRLIVLIGMSRFIKSSFQKVEKSVEKLESK
jgi:hypothetical protein